MMAPTWAKLMTVITAIGTQASGGTVNPTPPGPNPEESEPEDLLFGLIDLEVALVEAYRWPLSAIDETNTASLLDFVHRLNARSEPAGSNPNQRTFTVIRCPDYEPMQRLPIFSPKPVVL